MTRIKIMKLVATLLLATIVILGAAPAGADEYVTIDETQNDLAIRALEAHHAGDFERAVELYRAALLIKEVNALHLNMGRALQRGGSCQRADKAYQRALVAPPLREAPSPKQVVAAVKKYRAELQSTCAGGVIVECYGELSVDDKPASCGVTIALLPGEHTARVAGEDRVFTVVGLAVTGVRFNVGEIVSGRPGSEWDPGSNTTAPSITSTTTGVPSATTLVGWGLVGAGAASLGVGVYFSAEVKRLSDDFVLAGRRNPVDSDEVDRLNAEADTVELGQYFAYGIGAATLVTGIVFLLLEEDPAEVPATTVVFTEGGALVGFSTDW
jgi:hypothetical protein